MNEKLDRPPGNTLPVCLICDQPLSIRLARGRKSNKPFVMLLCANDGRHFRGFISHRPYVEQVLARLEERQKQNGDLP